jgi:hypothetical protein
MNLPDAAASALDAPALLELLRRARAVCPRRADNSIFV